MNNQIDQATPLITLVGPPNSGKTTLFNYLSGKHFKTVNYPGSTVDYSVSKIQSKFNLQGNLLDSPGIISLVPASPDEAVAVDALYSHPKYGNPDIVVSTADATQLSRHLLLTKQLIESGFKVILVITMTDLLRKRNYDISLSKLSKLLDCKVIKVDGRNGDGLEELIKTISQELKSDSLSKEIKKFKIDDNFPILNMFQQSEEIEKEVIFSKANDKRLKEADNQLQIIQDYKIDHRTLKIDSILLHKYWGLLSFFLIMSFTFTSVFWFAQPLMDLIDSTFGFLGSYTAEHLGDTWYSSLISSGIISGIGSVLVFVPQILILFLILGLLEDTGYLARGAMLVDKPLSKIGLNGKSFVPLLSGFACAVPAIMAARTIPNRRERLLTIFIIPLISCSARLPVYALLIGFLVPYQNKWLGGMILAAIYIFGMFSSVFVSAIINKIQNRFASRESVSSFILELPAYRVPKISVVFNNMVNNAKQYIERAGPTILVFAIILWFLSYFPNVNPHVNEAGLSKDQIEIVKNDQRLADSYSAQLGRFIQPVMKPLGMDWRVGVSLISAFAAREIFVSSLAMIFRVTDESSDLQQSILSSMRKAEIEGTNQKLFTTATIIGLIVFFIFALQCISTITISHKETGGWKIPALQLLTFTSLAYILTFITVNGLRAIGIN